MLALSNDSILDDINLQIIEILGKDSSKQFSEIAKQIGVSEATVHVRVKQLKTEGVISKFTLTLDNEILGYDHLSFAGINVKPGTIEQTIQVLSNVKEVLEIHETYGKSDLLVKIRAKNLEDMRNIIENKIRILPNILDTELTTVLKTDKEEQTVSLNKDMTDCNHNNNSK
jgi:Lrp/AsnC family transcriptional regulator for asnA, asnC and gidA